MVRAMSGSAPGRVAIQPIQLGTLPRPDEGSKGAPFLVRWSDVPLVQTPEGGKRIASFNLLAQYQLGQFTSIQAVYIDNATCKVPVDFTCLETGQSVRCPAFAQAMFPLVSGVAPNFTLQFTNDPAGPNLGQSTKFILFNTPQRPYVNVVGPVFVGGAVTVQPAATGPFPATFQVINNAGLAPTRLYMRLLGFQLSIANAGGAAFAANTQITVALTHNNSLPPYWEDNFNVSPASFGTLYSKDVQFPEPQNPVDQNDTWELFVTATTANGVLFYFTYYYDYVLMR